MNRIWLRIHEHLHGPVLMVHTGANTQLKCDCGAVRVL